MKILFQVLLIFGLIYDFSYSFRFMNFCDLSFNYLEFTNDSHSVINYL